MCLAKLFTVIAITVPLAVLGFGYAVGWVVMGFRPYDWNFSINDNWFDASVLIKLYVKEAKSDVVRNHF